MAAQAPPRPIPKGTNVLVGRVLEAGSDSPVGGAAVTLGSFFDAAGKPAPPPVQPGREQPAARTVMTTTDGYFFFRDLPAGRYSISAAAFGYVRHDFPAHQVDVPDREKPSATTLRIWKHGVISGTVVDEKGEPVVGLPVTALRRVSIGGVLQLRQAYVDAETDDRGMYRIAPLPPGSYIVGVMSSTSSVPAGLAAEVDAVASNPRASFALTSSLIPLGSMFVRSGEGQRIGDFVHQTSGPPLVFSPEGKLLAFATTLYPGSTNAAEATVVSVGSGESRNGIDVPVRFLPTVRVSGIATGPDGPVKNLAIRLIPGSAGNAGDSQPIGMATAVTDAGGKFVFLSVPPGQYSLKATITTGENAGGVSLWAAQSLTVGDTDITSMAVALQPGLRVSGRVEFRGSADRPPEAYERVNISLRPIGAQTWRTFPGLVQADGTFTTPGDPPGRYELYASSAAGWRVLSVSRAGGIAPDHIIDLGSGGLSVTVVVSDKQAHLSGTIADAGAVAPDLDVIAFPADTAVWREGIFHSRRVQRVRVTSSGAFEFNALAPGDYFVTAVGQRWTLEWQDPLFLERLIPGASQVTLGDGERKTLSLKTFTPRGR